MYRNRFLHIDQLREWCVCVCVCGVCGVCVCVCGVCVCVCGVCVCGVCMCGVCGVCVCVWCVLELEDVCMPQLAFVTVFMCIRMYSELLLICNRFSKNMMANEFGGLTGYLLLFV